MPNSIFGTNTGSNNNRKSPLYRAPFYSRFTDFEESGKNYILIGFTPGLALQAAELNEIQDNFHKNLTLSNLMFSNWVPYVSQFIKDNDTPVITDILWDGVVPLDPTQVSKDINNNITFNTGWYYYTHGSGLCFWVHTPTQFIINAQSAVLNTSSTSYVGFSINTRDIFATDDNRLYDNSSGSPNTASPGAYRVAHDFMRINISTSPSQYKNILTIQNGSIIWPNGIPLGA